MVRETITVVFSLLLVIGLTAGCDGSDNVMSTEDDTQVEQLVELPEVSRESKMSVEESLEARRSVREFSEEGLSIDEIGQLVWAAQGITEPARGFRTAPSAGALYPLEVYVVTDKSRDEELESGVYRYLPNEHSLKKIIEEDKREELYEAALRQDSIREAPVSIVITSVYERVTQRYGDRGEIYAHIEVGHVAQNIYLQVESLGLGTVIIGAFEDEEFKQILNLEEGEEPLVILPVGRL